jgi:hypothetical protein
LPAARKAEAEALPVAEESTVRTSLGLSQQTLLERAAEQTTVENSPVVERMTSEIQLRRDEASQSQA